MENDSKSSSMRNREEIPCELVGYDLHIQEQLENLTEENFQDLVEYINKNIFPYSYGVAMLICDIISMIKYFPKKVEILARFTIEVDKKYKQYIIDNKIDIRVTEIWLKEDDLSYDFPILYKIIKQGLYIPRMIFELDKHEEIKNLGPFKNQEPGFKKVFDFENPENKDIDRQSGYQKDSIENIIYYDDVEKLKNYRDQMDFSKENEIKNFYDACSMYSIQKKNLKLTYLEFAAMHGSKKCFDYILTKNPTINYKALKMSINGDNKEIIDQLFQHFEDKLKNDEIEGQRTIQSAPNQNKITKDKRSFGRPKQDTIKKLSSSALLNDKKTTTPSNSANLTKYGIRSRLRRHAIKNHRFEKFNFLFESKSENEDNEKYLRDLEVCCIYNNTRAACNIIEKYPESVEYPQSKDPKICFCKPLHRALQGNSLGCILKLLNNPSVSPDQPATNFSTPMNWSCGWNCIEGTRLLMMKGAHINREGKSRQPLMSACGKDYSVIVDMLLKSHVEINHLDSKGSSSLLQAVENNCWKSCYLLLKAGAEIDYQDPRNGCTALHNAVYKGYSLCTALLIRFGAKTNIPDKNGITIEQFLENSNGYEEIKNILNFNYRSDVRYKVLEKAGFNVKTDFGPEESEKIIRPKLQYPDEVL